MIDLDLQPTKMWSCRTSTHWIWWYLTRTTAFSETHTPPNSATYQSDSVAHCKCTGWCNCRSPPAARWTMLTNISVELVQLMLQLLTTTQLQNYTHCCIAGSLLWIGAQWNVGRIMWSRWNLRICLCRLGICRPLVWRGVFWVLFFRSRVRGFFGIRLARIVFLSSEAIKAGFIIRFCSGSPDFIDFDFFQLQVTKIPAKNT